MTQKLTEKSPGNRCAARYRALGLLVLFAICASQLVLIAGCHRGFYRRQADAEARRLITEKHGSRWNSATGDIAIDPMSRMFDPFSADHPPIPPDDPAAHKLLHNVDDKPGYPHWHANGNIDQVENPTWESYLPTNENGEVVLSLSNAYRLALIHSPDLQQQRETLYLSALEVSIQRFGFDSQLFSGFNSFFDSSGSANTGTGTSSTSISSSLGNNGQGIQASRLGIAGATFAAGLANTILWEFSGNNTQSANSLIDFSVIQPLLRGAGRERILESLTQSERTLLANVRQLERFRRGFYLEVAMGRNAGAGPSAGGTGAFLNQPGLAGSNVGGYLGLLQQKQIINNIEFSVAQFETLLKQFRELFERDRIDKLQVAQFETSVYNQQQALLNSRIAYQNSLDAFKILLGLPPDVDVVIEDPFLDGFKLIDDGFSRRLRDIKKLREEISEPIVAFGGTARKLAREAALQEEEGEEPDVEDGDLKRQLKALLPQLMQARELVVAIKDEDRGRVKKDINQLGEVRDRRVSYLKSVKDDIEAGRIESQVEPRVFTADSVPEKDQLVFQLDDESNKQSLVAKLEGVIDEIDDRIERIKSGEKPDLTGSKFYERLENEFAKRIPDLLTKADGIILEMALLQATARSNVIEIVDVKIDANEAFETARCLRRDWMNARTALVDNWRQIEFFADQLEAEVDLVLTGEIGNAGGDNPFRLRFDDGNIRAGFQFDAPIVRQAERNDYRQAQIAYQQARRSYYQFEDSINQSLRQTIRNINQDKVLFELNRQNTQVNIDQVQLARARLVEPPRVGATSNLDTTTATFLTSAINGLTGVQNSYLGLWTEYEVLRRTLDFDMGTMEFDESFEWVDPGMIDATIGQRVAVREGIAENDRFCCGMQQASALAYPEEYLDVETLNPEDNVMIDAPPESAPIEYAPVDTEGVNTPEFENDTVSPVVPDSLQINDPPPVPQVDPPLEPLVEPTIEVPSLDTTKSIPVSSGSSVRFSRSSSSRAGHLDPFRKKYGPVNSNQTTLVGAAKQNEAVADAVEPVGSPLNRAFQQRVIEPQPQPARELRAQATILQRK